MTTKKISGKGLTNRRRWDIVLKWLFQETITSAGIKAEILPEVELGKQPARIDLIIKVNNTDKLSSYEGSLGFIIKELKKITLVEFKSLTDSVTKGLFKRLVGHWGHYGDQMAVDWSSWKNDFGGLLLVAKNSDVIINDLRPDSGSFTVVSEGVYQLTFPFKTMIVDFSQLPVTFDTIPLVLLTDRSKRRIAIEKIFKSKQLLNYLEVCYWLYPQEVKTIAESLNEDVPLNIKKAVELIGISTVIREIGIDSFLDEIGEEAIKEWLSRKEKKSK